MKTFLIAELQNPQSVRKAEYVICANLAAAKRAATRRQVFRRTCMEVCDEAGNRLSLRVPSGRWVDTFESC